MGCAGEDTLALCDGRHSGDACNPDRLLLPLVAAKKEEPVAEHGSAKGRAELVPAVLWLPCVGARKVVAGVQLFIAQELIQAAMDGVRPGSRRQVHEAPVEPSKLRRHIVRLDGELLDVVDDGKERNLAGLRLQRRDAVEEVLVGTRTTAVDARQERAGR